MPWLQCQIAFAPSHQGIGLERSRRESLGIIPSWWPKGHHLPCSRSSAVSACGSLSVPPWPGLSRWVHRPLALRCATPGGASLRARDPWTTWTSLRHPRSGHDRPTGGGTASRPLTPTRHPPRLPVGRRASAVQAAASAPDQGVRLRAIAFRITRIRRITAVNATLPGRPFFSRRRSYTARIAGL